MILQDVLVDEKDISVPGRSLDSRLQIEYNRVNFRKRGASRMSTLG